MDYRISPDERSRFKRCRRQWDYASPNRQDLEALAPPGASLQSAIKDALAAYYYPGTWDWQRQIVIPLVRKAFQRAVGEQRGSDQDRAALVEQGTPLLERYLGWAPTLDNFAPIKIDHDVEGLIMNPLDLESGLLTPDGRRVIYTERIDLLAVDADDEYWVVRHLVVDDWQDVNTMLLDEQAVAGCWGWEQIYLGMEIAGTIHNEIRGTADADEPEPPDQVELDSADLPRVAGNDASGGGRNIPQHRRLYAQSHASEPKPRVVQESAGPIRRTWIRRSRDEIEAMSRQIGTEALLMLDAGSAVFPTPAAHCQACEFVAPCLATTEGSDPSQILAEGYRRREPVPPVKAKLGQTTWSIGRGAAPPPKW
ncbi:MAG: hypothetical protein WCB04_06750 [Mycobacteriales bacterium]